MDIKIMRAALVFGERNIEHENWKPIKDSLRGTIIIALLFWILLFSTVFISEDTHIVLDAFTENTAQVTDDAAIEASSEESFVDQVLDVLQIIGGIICIVLDLFVTVVLARHLYGEDWYNYYWWFIDYVYFWRINHGKRLCKFCTEVNT